MLKTIKDIIALLAGEFLGRIFIGIGLFGLIGGMILLPIIIYNIALAFESTKDSAGLITGIISVITFVLSLAFTGLGILLLVWAKKKEI